MQGNSGKYLLKGKRAGVAPLLIVVMILMIVVVAGVGVYYLSLSPSIPGPSHTTSTVSTGPSGIHT